MCEVCMVCGKKLSALHTGHPTCSDCKAKRVGGWDVRTLYICVRLKRYYTVATAHHEVFKGILPDAKKRLRELLADRGIGWVGAITSGGETIYFEEWRG